MDIIFRKAQRRAVPMLISLSSVSGGGKTYSALLLAAGIAGKEGRVGFIDTENGRGEMYCDSPGILKAFPNSYDYARIDPPFSPDAYIEAISAAERAGVTVLVIDSQTHEWEGIGGCCEIAEKNKLKGLPNWAKAKMAHKRFMNHCLSSPMTLIFCVRAREKVKMLESNGKTEVIPIGLQAITEKNFIFEMTLSLMLEEQTHFANATKVPEPLKPLFPGGRMVTMQDGEKLRQWNATASAATEESDRLRQRAKAAADEGAAAYEVFVVSLTNPQKVLIGKAFHEECRGIAAQVDAQQSVSDLEEFSSLRDTLGDETYFRILGTNGVENPAMATAVERGKLLDQLRGLVAA